MEQFSFVFTIFFMLLGPVKIIPAFSALMRDAEKGWKRRVAVHGGLIASGIVTFVAISGEVLLGKYRISLDALRIAGGLVLLAAAFNMIFPRSQPPSTPAGKRTVTELAVSPVASPIVVPPAGIAAILIFVMIAPDYPGMMPAVAVCLVIMMVLDFLVMYFIDRVTATPGLMLFLQVLGSILVFMQIGLAVQTMLSALKHLGVIKA